MDQNITLTQWVTQLNTSGSLSDAGNYIPMDSTASMAALGVKQHTDAWYMARHGCVTGSMASYALNPNKTGRCASREVYYHYLATGDATVLSAVRGYKFNPCGPTKHGSIPKGFTQNDVMLWGSMHERSAVLTLLSYVDRHSDPNIRDGKFYEVGMLSVREKTGVKSSPDGQFMCADGSDLAVEVKCAFMDGRGFPHKRVPLGHYVQVQLEIMAIGEGCQGGWYLSWSAGAGASRLFYVERNEQFCSELLAYLDDFQAAAKDGVPLARFDDDNMGGARKSGVPLARFDDEKMGGSRARQLYQDAARNANDPHQVYLVQKLFSVVDKVPALSCAMRDLMSKADVYWARLDGETTPTPSPRVYSFFFSS
jgi:hypothetical protein